MLSPQRGAHSLQPYLDKIMHLANAHHLEGHAAGPLNPNPLCAKPLSQHHVFKTVLSSMRGACFVSCRPGNGHLVEARAPFYNFMPPLISKMITPSQRECHLGSESSFPHHKIAILQTLKMTLSSRCRARLSRVTLSLKRCAHVQQRHDV